MIYKITDTFDFSQLLLNKPIMINGSYVIKFNIKEKPLYLQFPECKLKNGIQKTGKRYYCDLMFSNENEKLIEWMENLESHCKTSIFCNRSWFSGDLEEEDIDSFFMSTLKSFKSGKYYTMRVHVPVDLGIYDESGENKLSFDFITEQVCVIAIIELIGIKCSDKNFQIEAQVKQMLTVKEIFDKCLIQPLSSSSVPLPSLEKDEEPTFPKIKEEKLSLTFSENTKLREEPLDDLSLVNLEELVVDEQPFQLKKRDDIYHKMYKEAKEKAKNAKRVALMAYLEAKRIKNEYMIDDIQNDSESDNEE